jgi:uncharacterized protein
VLEKLADYVREKLRRSPGCHDWEHTKRVLANALLISEILVSESAEIDLKVVKAGALLHDIARPEELESESGICHAKLGASMVPDIFRNLKITGISADTVARCVERHRYRDDNHPETIEEKIIFDADKLDSLGAVGVARAIHFSGRIGSVLHNKADTALNSAPYSKEDSAYREFLVKLRYIPDRMLTQPGKQIAAERYIFMEEFFKRINKEIYGTASLLV